MPLIYADINDEYIIKRITGDSEVKLHLENLGFVVGTPVRIVTKVGENLIIRIRETRVALNRDMAMRIFV